MKYNLGVDVGGTKIEGVIALNNDVLYTIRKETQAHLGYHHILSNISTVYNSLVAHVGGSSHTIGIGTPGSLMETTGTLRNCNVCEMNNRPIKADLEDILGRKIILENDANCFVLAEAIHSGEWEDATIFGAVLGTGCGAGVVVNGKLIDGKNRLAGEWGHMSINRNGLKCYCGRRGCVERYISGRGIEDIYENITGNRIGMEAICEGFRQGRKTESNIIENFLDDVSFSLANVVSVLDPHVVIIGGGLSSIQPLFQLLPEKLSSMINRNEDMFKIQKARLGDSAGSLGAAIRGAAD